MRSNVRPSLVLLALLAGCAAPQTPAAGPTPTPSPEPAPAPAVRAPAPAPSLPTSVAPGDEDPRIREIVGAASPARLEHDDRMLVSFGTRHTLSDTLSDMRGIGAARRWIYSEFQRISQSCGGCLEVFYVADTLQAKPHSRIDREVAIVDVVAVLRGQVHPDHYLVMQGHYDSRVTDVMDSTSTAPGANDDGSGTVATLEAARLLSRYPSDQSIVFAALAGEEQGLFGGSALANYAKAHGWKVEGVLNNDIVGNTHGENGVVDNTHFRVFAAGIPPSATDRELAQFLYHGGELDTPSRELGRYIVDVAHTYVPNFEGYLIYRLDRFGRGSDQTPWFLLGYPAVRMTESAENYTRQHQDLRTESGIRYGDLPDSVDFPYLAKMTGTNAATLASLAWAPLPPEQVKIRGAVEPSTTLSWTPSPAPDLAGYRIYWRRPTSATWTWSRWVGNVTEATLENIVIDDYFFAVAAVDRAGHESLPVYPNR